MARDIVVIGASAGGFSALQDLAAGMSPNFPATLFVVVHSSPDSPGMLPELLSRAGPLPVKHAVHGESFEKGRIYVAPPNHHLLIEDGVVQTTLGPRENGFRPAVDPLFRTAAQQHGARVVGIVLSGALDDGTRGLQHIKREGGVAIAQHLEDAVIPHMPLSAIRNVEVDHILPAAEIPAVLAQLASQGVATKMKPNGRKRTAKLNGNGARKLDEEGPPAGNLSSFTCPDCGGALWERVDGKVVSFACHVGHKFTGESLGAGADDRIELAMWTAFRTLEENTALQRRLAERAYASGLRALARRHEDRARAASDRAETIRTVLMDEPAAAAKRPRTSRKGRAARK